MTKEKPLIEIMETRIFCVNCNNSKELCECIDIDLAIRHAVWFHVIKSDLALHIKMLKKRLYREDNKDKLKIPRSWEIIDEVMGTFK